MTAALGPRISRELDLLEKAFGRPRPARRLPPLDELILPILSQHTNDVNRDRAYVKLCRRFPTWESVLRASREEVEDAIRVGGLAPTKSRVIQDVLRAILRDQGRLDLGVLQRMPADEAKAYLLGLRGVGEKTACCVLLFSCGRPAFPVDTHIHRVARRLGWVPSKATAARTHALLAAMIPAGRCYAAHNNLITLGRRICRSRTPACPSCPLRRGCRYAVTSLRRGVLRGPRRRPAIY